jgi:hypothetical protein
MKNYIILLFLLISSSAFTQSLTTVFHLKIDSFYYHKIIDVEIYEDNIYILGEQKDKDSNTANFILTTVSFNGIVINQSRIKEGKYDMLYDISINKNYLLLSGGIWNDDLTKDYIMLLDKELNLIWDKELETKWEGAIMSISYNNGFLIATNNGSKGVFLYTIDLKGEIADKINIQTMQPKGNGLFNLPDSQFLLISLTLNSNGESQIELRTFDKIFKVLNKSILPVTQKDYLDNYYSPDQIKFLDNMKIVSLWNAIPPITTFSSTTDTINYSIMHIRHDISFYDIENYKNETYVYSGILGKEATIFLVENEKIITKTSFGNMGTWSKNKLLKITKSDYIMISDRIRESDFETNIEIIRIHIE